MSGWDHGMRHPGDMGEEEVNRFLTYLAVERHVSPSTQTQALSAILFLYRYVLGRQLGDLGSLVRARKQRHLPVVLSRDEVRAVLGHLTGDTWLMASLMYGSGLRISECLALRVQHLDLERRTILVRDGKGSKDRSTMLPGGLVEPLAAHLEAVREVHRRDLAQGFGRVALPDALKRKYPAAPTEWGWQPHRGAEGRHHKARHLPHPPPLVRHPPPRGRRGRPHTTGAPWARRSEDHHALYPRAGPRAGGDPEPVGSDVGSRWGLRGPAYAKA